MPAKRHHEITNVNELREIVNEPPGETKTFYDPTCFQWHDKIERFVKREMAIIIHPKGEMRLLAAAGEMFIKVAEVGDDGFYRVSIGIAPKALAIRPLKPEGKGYRVRKTSKSGALYISCSKLIKGLNWVLPAKLPAVWDEKHQMLVGKLI